LIFVLAQEIKGFRHEEFNSEEIDVDEADMYERLDMHVPTATMKSTGKVVSAGVGILFHTWRYMVVALPLVIFFVIGLVVQKKAPIPYLEIIRDWRF